MYLDNTEMVACLIVIQTCHAPGIKQHYQLLVKVPLEVVYSLMHAGCLVLARARPRRNQPGIAEAAEGVSHIKLWHLGCQQLRRKGEEWGTVRGYKKYREQATVHLCKCMRALLRGKCWLSAIGTAVVIADYQAAGQVRLSDIGTAVVIADYQADGPVRIPGRVTRPRLSTGA